MIKSVIFVTGSLADGGAEKVMSILASGCAELGADVTLVVLRPKKIVYPVSDKVKIVQFTDVLPEKPIRFDEMKKIAAVLSKGLPHLRVDFYCANGKLYVGELTFYHCSGFAPIQPEEWAIKMGEWIKLPTSK